MSFGNNLNQASLPVSVNPDGVKKNHKTTDAVGPVNITVGRINITFSVQSTEEIVYDTDAFVKLAEISAGVKKFIARLMSLMPGQGGGTP